MKSGQINGSDCPDCGLWSHLLSDELLLTERVSGLVRDVVHWALVHLEKQPSQLGILTVL